MQKLQPTAKVKLDTIDAARLHGAPLSVTPGTDFKSLNAWSEVRITTACCPGKRYNLFASTTF